MKDTLVRYKLTILGLMLTACLPMLAQQSQTLQSSVTDTRAMAAVPAGYCVFESKNAYYQGGPPEGIRLVWRKSDGAVQSWDWLHGGVSWFSFAADKGTAKPDYPSYLNYYLLDVGITTSGYTSTRYSLRVLLRRILLCRQRHSPLSTRVPARHGSWRTARSTAVS